VPFDVSDVSLLVRGGVSVIAPHVGVETEILVGVTTEEAVNGRHLVLVDLVSGRVEDIVLDIVPTRGAGGTARIRVGEGVHRDDVGEESQVQWGDGMGCRNLNGLADQVEAGDEIGDPGVGSILTETEQDGENDLSVARIPDSRFENDLGFEWDSVAVDDMFGWPVEANFSEMKILLELMEAVGPCVPDDPSMVFVVDQSVRR